MMHTLESIPWRAVMIGMGVVYGIAFLFALLLAVNGITPETDRIGYPLLALLAGAVGVAIALRMAATTRPAYMAALGVGIWLLNSTSVMIGAQSFRSWLESSLFVFTTLILGRLLAGNRFASSTFPDEPVVTIRAHSLNRAPR
jgi:hypothetical protein